MDNTKIPEGYCQCGCGQRTKIVDRDDPKRGYKKGDYRRYANYHASNKNHLKPKTCVVCGKEFLPQKKNRQDTQRTCSARCRNTDNCRRTKLQRAEMLRGRGEGKAYPKLEGRHEHRVIAEMMLGRPLDPGEVVHHLNGDILDNRWENLEVLPSQSIHASIHNYERHQKRREKKIEVLP